MKPDVFHFTHPRVACVAICNGIVVKYIILDCEEEAAYCGGVTRGRFGGSGWGRLVYEK